MTTGEYWPAMIEGAENTVVAVETLIGDLRASRAEVERLRAEMELKRLRAEIERPADAEIDGWETAMNSSSVSHAHFTTTIGPVLIAALRAARDEVAQLREHLTDAGKMAREDYARAERAEAKVAELRYLLAAAADVISDHEGAPLSPAAWLRLSQRTANGTK